MKTILVTGSIDGIGKLTARGHVERGHRVLVHGRSKRKVEDTTRELSALSGDDVGGHVADLSRMGDVEALAREVAGRHDRLDVLIDNAGVLAAPNPRTEDGLDVRFAVNAVAPCLPTRRLLPLMGSSGRVVSLSSAAQSPVDLAALGGEGRLADLAASSQSKPASNAWSRALAEELGPGGPIVVAVNPGSMLGTNMVRDAFGSQGHDVGIGADILARAALSEEFEGASGRCYDNDASRFGPPHPDALDAGRTRAIVAAIEDVLTPIA